ncbi:MAG: UvrD-helicase domain-containing protein [Deltaproteobacteria bacterium]|jgi:DNA helicase II / ATP-dependent DNA helicase PcrA|nr:UvrD-helicase domain-containing protein [Deltaproteobacteria bacterium]
MSLNEQQQIAVDHTDGPLLVLAGPGSGKTRVLVHRIAKLIESGTAWPSQVLAVTFTNKAAGEMKRRIEKIVGSGARNIAVGTFHSTCLRLLRTHHEKVGYGSRFLVYDDSDQLALIKECMNTLNLDTNKVPPRSVLEKISRAKDSCVEASEYESQAGSNPYLSRISRVYNLYEKRLVELDAMDFGDLIRLVVKLFDSDPDLLQAYQHRWKYIMVDEYQDTNHAQYRLIGHLASEHKNLCVVGDDDQSIYRWRGADVSNILRFEEDFSGSLVVRLEQNYRSTKSILTAAAAVVSNNSGRKFKEIWTDRGEGDRVQVVSCDSERKEAEVVAKGISEVRAGGSAYGDISIFYRTNAQSRPLEDMFRANGIPYRIYGGLRFYERAEVKDIIAYLRLISDFHDDVSFRRIVNAPVRGIGKTTVSRLDEFARSRSTSLFEAIGSFLDSGSIRRSSAKKLYEFSTMISDLSHDSLAKPLGELVRNVLERSGYIEALAKASSIEAEARIENINELVTAMEEFISNDDSYPLTQFLDQVALVSDTDSMSDDSGAVTMMTMHLAKGLEYPNVFIVGMEEGLFPHARSLDDPDELEEERRLCYVGMTRAMEKLTLTHAFRRRHFGTERYNVASRFLDEIPKRYVERKAFGHPSPQIRTNSFSKQGESTPNRSNLSPNNSSSDFDFDFDQRPAEERVDPYMRGTRVKHPTFGAGVVRTCEKTNAGHKVTVRFQDGQIKKLIAECAGLITI